MYAVVKTGGKQYRVETGNVLEVEYIEGDVGTAVELNEVLLVSGEKGTKVGQPLVAGATVRTSIVEQKRGPKLIIYKKLRRHGKRWKKGHRQELTRLKIEEIVA